MKRKLLGLVILALLLFVPLMVHAATAGKFTSVEGNVDVTAPGKEARPANLGDLLKTTISSQIFTVSGSPRTSIKQLKTGEYVVTMEGVDIYDPVANTVHSTGAAKVAAWFLDSDYDGRCFCICQAFFPDKSAWTKLAKAMGNALDEDALAKLSGTESLPFPIGEHKTIAIKVIDPHGNEVLCVHKLGENYA